MNYKLLFRIAFLLLGLATVSMIAAAFIGNREGETFVNRYFYGSAWFVLMWIAIAVVSVLTFLTVKNVNRLSALFHLSFIFIIAGALTTYFTGEKGLIHLRTDSDAVMQDIKLPFSIKLTDFKIDYYEGKEMPSNYVSFVEICDGQTRFSTEISMNKIFKYRGYRFYQSQYDPDMGGSILSITHDPIGIGLVYTGFAIFFISGLMFFFSKRSGFVKILKSFCIVLFVLIAGNVDAQNTLGKEQCNELSKVLIMYHGRPAPLDTYARDFLKKIYGGSSYHNFSAVQVLSGFIFYPDQWFDEDIINVNNSSIQKITDGESYISFNEFIDKGYESRLADCKDINPRDLIKFFEKPSLIVGLSQDLKIFPSGGIFYSPVDELYDIPYTDSLFIKGFFVLLDQSVRDADNKTSAELIRKLKIFQTRNIDKPISSTKISIELIYNRLDLCKILFMINLFAGFLSVVLVIKNKTVALSAARMWCLISGLILLIYWIMRWIIGDHIPLASGYDTLLFMSILISAVSWAFAKRILLIIPCGLLLSGFMLLVSNLGMNDPQISNLMPVLHSPWLSIHVCVVMFAYALFAMMFALAVAALITGNKSKILQDRIEKMIRLFHWPALFFLGCGIITGSVWANISWGRYWGWDPKETWALITFAVYAAGIHNTLFGVLRKSRFYFIYITAAFMFVLMTYLGVNVFFGGMHSYSG